MSEIDYMNECTSRDIILLLMEREGKPLKEAMNLWYSSHTYALLKEKETGLYFQSPLYIYSNLQEELSESLKLQE